MSSTPYNVNQLLDAIFKPVHTNLNDPDTYNAGYEARVDSEIERLLDAPVELDNADIHDVFDIYKKHHNDLMLLGNELDKYMKGLARKQAKELINSEYE